MKVLTGFQKCRLVFLSLLIFQGISLGQSLYDVVISLSDRQRVVNQRDQVSVYLVNQNNNPGDTDQAIPGDRPIGWEGIGTNPTQSAVDGLNLAARITLLNQVAREFDRLKLFFLNSSPGEFESGSIIGALKSYTPSDFDSLPRAAPENYHLILRLLAQRVRALHLIQWPSDFRLKSFTDKTDVREVVDYHDPQDSNQDGNREPYVKVVTPDGTTTPAPGNWTPASIGPGNLNVYISDLTNYATSQYSSFIEVNGTYSESPSHVEEITAPLRRMWLQLSGYYPEEARVSATAPGGAGMQIDGTVYVLRRSKWNQIVITGASPRYEPSEAGYVVDGGSNSGTVPLFSSPPSATVNGSWVTTQEYSNENGHYLNQRFVEAGYQYKEAWTLPHNDEGYSDNYTHSYEQNWGIGCSFYSVFKPTFTSGVDAPGMGTKLEAAGSVLAENAADGNLLLHPRPSLLYGIDLGPGLKGAGNGYVSTTPMELGGSGYWNYYDYYVDSDYYDWCSMMRFDSSYSLQFAGSCSDYHVVYENDRSNRIQSLPADSLGWQFTDIYNTTQYDTQKLYRAWDSPRLKQVAGRDLVADVTYNANHYGGYTVKIYRRQTGDSAPTPGQAMDLSGMTLIRTWTFSHAGGSTPHPTDAEKLEVTGSGGEKYEIKANEVLSNQGLGWPYWEYYGYYFNDWWWTSGTNSWTLKLSQDNTEKLKNEIEVNRTSDTNGWHMNTTLHDSVDGQLVSSLYSTSLNPFNDQIPTDWTITTSEKTITASAILDSNGKWPTSVSIQYDGIQPDAEYSWDANGLLSSFTQGAWSITGTMDGDSYKQTHKFNTTTYTTDWTQLLDGGNRVRHYTASDGNAGNKTEASVAWSEVEYGTATSGLPGLPGLPRITKNSDGTGATYDWSFISPSNSDQLILTAGQLSGNTVTRGTKLIQQINGSGQTTTSESYLINGGTLKTGGTDYSEFTAWGFPKKSTDSNTGLSSTWDFDNNLSRFATHTNALGTTSSFTGYDPLGRPGTVSHNGITSTNTYTATSSGAFITTATISEGATGSIANTHDGLGRLLKSNTTWNDVADNLTVTPDTATTAITHETLLGTYNASVQNSDGLLATATGPTLPFGGNQGTSLTVDNGLLKTTTRLMKDNPSPTGTPTGTFSTTWTDAWGRIRETTTPTGDTQSLYSGAASSLKRVITTEPSGRKLITESDPYNSSGAISRSGIDTNNDGQLTLSSTDRYVQSTTAVSGTAIITVLKLTEDTGLREILRTEWTPSGNVTVTKINGSEETITRTPNYTTKTVKTTSTKGWEKNESFNNLGLTTSSALSGSGIPAATLNPVWRADGSLASVSLTIDGEVNSANFNNNGTLSSLNAPGRGNILGGHSISGGVEALTVNNVTNTRKLDGTFSSTSGGDTLGKTDELTTTGGRFNLATTPATGAATNVAFNAAGAPTAKSYAAGAGESRHYRPGGLLEKVTLARGVDLTFGYSNDGAKDLTSATWPAVPSGVFGNIPSIVQGYGYDRAGRINGIGDSSGARSLVYQNGRLKQSTWDSGALAGYKVIRGLDTTGRETGFELWRGNVLIHSAARGFTGDTNESDETATVTSGNLNVAINRNGARQITGFDWGNSSGSFNPTVSQRWQRGTAGRILLADSNNTVSGAPTFDYKGTANNEATSFDGQGRRLKVKTAGADWTYTNGQLTTASHPTLGSFSYQFDAIGRRTENSANTASVLNQSIAWTNSQNKTLKITAAPAARLWVGIGTATPTEIPNFTGAYSYPITPPGTSGGWVPWNTLAVLSGQGDSGANPDAKAEKSGAVWVPPISESFTYDAAGNRESSALWNYGWNAKNELVRARTKNHNNHLTPQGYDITNAYDAEGRRFSKKVNRYQNGSIVEQKIITFLHDGDDLIYERHQLSSGLTILERKYVWGPDLAGGAGGLLLIRETIGNSTIDLYPLYDGTGHVIALADSTGALQAEYAYGPFGETIYARGPKASSCPFRYATKYYDEETGLYNFGIRFLDPITGQWLSRESLGESESLNLYSYCHNDPVNKVDALGLAEVAVDATLNNGIPTMIYEEWAGSGLAYLWNAMAAGKVKTWGQSPNAGEMARLFYFEDGRWQLRSADGRHNAGMDEALAAIPQEMEQIKPVMDTMEIGGAAVASAPFTVLAGSAEVGAGISVYGGQALSSAWAQGAFALLGTQTAYEFATDEGFRQDFIGTALSDPNGVQSTGEFLGAGVSGLSRNGAAIWNSMKPAIGEGVEQLLYRSGGLAYAVPPAPASSGGAFMSWWKSANGITHGNSLAATGPHDVYVIRDAVSGQLLHFGETGRGLSTRFAEHQRAFAKMGIDIIGQPLKSVEGKAAAKEMERVYIETYRRLYGIRPPFNRSSH